jgi:hypothetical protein
MGTKRDEMIAAASSWLIRRRGLVVAVAMVAVATALAVGQHWVAVADLLPLLYVLPCAVMLFVCMKGHGPETDTKQISARSDTSAPSGGPQPT